MPTLRPTFSESWYRVADLRVRLRPSAQISRQYYRGERWYVVRDPAGNQFHRLSAPAYRFVGLLDGTRTVAEAWELVGGQLADDAPTQNEVIQILSQLHSANLIESNITPDAAVLLRRHKKMVQRQWQGRLMNILFPRIPLWDCDQFLKRWMPLMRIFLSKFGALLWLAVVIFAIVNDRARLVASCRPALKTPSRRSNWPFLWASVRADQGDPRVGARLHLPAIRRGGARAGHHVPGARARALRGCIHGVGLPQQVAADPRRRGRHDLRAVRRRDHGDRVAEHARQGTLVNQLAYNTDADRQRLDGHLQRQPAAALRRLLHAVGPGWRFPTSATGPPNTPWG